MSSVSKRFGISDVALAKACAKVQVPVPQRGYWARRAVGKAVVTIALPARALGEADEIEIPANRYGYHGGRYTDEEILGPVPPPPTFDEPIESMRERVYAQIGDVTVPRLSYKCHTLVSRLLASDEQRSAEIAVKPYMATYHPPLFDDTIGRRRLRLLSAVLLAVTRSGARVDGSGKPDPDNVRIVVGRQGVHLAVKVVETRKRFGRGAEAKMQVERHLTVELNPGHSGRPAARSWEDGDLPLEKRLREITVELLVAGEAGHRGDVMSTYANRVARKARLEEDARRQRAEREAAERARVAELERKRVERLLAEAAASEKARIIRRYVDDVRAADAASPSPMPQSELEEWAAWALGQADCLDPVANGSFRRERD